MATHSPSGEFEKAVGDTKKQAAGVVNEASNAAKDLYDQAIDSTARVAGSAQNAARRSAGSFEKALRGTIENQPYSAVLIGIGIGWLLGRAHRPL